MPMGHVTIAGKATRVARDGSFRILLHGGEMYAALFTGVDHGDHTASLLMPESEVELSVRLGTYEAPATQPDLELVEIRFKDNGDISLGALTPMVKGSDGKFRATVTTKAGEFAYEIRGTVADSGRSMNGSARTAFRYDGDGNYCNVVEAPGGALVVEHDPRLANPANLATRLVFADATSKIARLAAIFDASRGEQPEEERLAMIRDEADAFYRHARVMALFAAMKGPTFEPSETRIALARATLAGVPADSPLWIAAPTSIVAMATMAGIDHAERVEGLVRHFLSRDRDRIASEIALSMLVQAAHASDEVALRRYFSLITSELKGTPAAKAAMLFDPAREIRLGKSLPTFSLPSADGDERFANAQYEGKVLLVDFWATWCGPCMEEMPNLHATYEELHHAGFEILSINVDDKPGRGQAMRRRGEFPMPWHNVVLEGRAGREMKRRFEVFALPSMILVDGDGTILATDFAIRGMGLRRKVRAALAAQAAPASQ
jgi:thiol-disulfide isomerase/thioredoxin